MVFYQNTMNEIRRMPAIMGTPAIFVAFLVAFALAPQTHADELEKNFATPPDSSKPLTFWFAVNGNITKPGITADLEAMKEIGLGGTLHINAISAKSDILQGVCKGAVRADVQNDIKSHARM